MSADIENKRVPDHLVGTREGLFHVLRGSEIFPQEDPMARAELPRGARFGDVLLQSFKSRATPVFPDSDQHGFADFLFEDEFCFIRS